MSQWHALIATFCHRLPLRRRPHAMRGWAVVINALVSAEPSLLTYVLDKPAAGGGYLPVGAARAEANDSAHRVRVLKRLSFILLAGERDQYAHVGTRTPSRGGTPHPSQDQSLTAPRPDSFLPFGAHGVPATLSPTQQSKVTPHSGSPLVVLSLYVQVHLLHAPHPRKARRCLQGPGCAREPRPCCRLAAAALLLHPATAHVCGAGSHGVPDLPLHARAQRAHPGLTDNAGRGRTSIQLPP